MDEEEIKKATSNLIKNASGLASDFIKSVKQELEDSELKTTAKKVSSAATEQFENITGQKRFERLESRFVEQIEFNETISEKLEEAYKTIQNLEKRITALEGKS